MRGFKGSHRHAGKDGKGSKVEGVVSRPEGDGYRGMKSKARRYNGAARVRPIAKNGWVIEELPGVISPDERVSPLSRSDDWRVVSRGKGGKVKLRRGVACVEAEPIPVSNRYEVLSGDSTNATPTPAPRAPPRRSRQCLGRKGTLVIGSSNVRRIMSPLRRMAQSEGGVGSLSSWCIPGGRVPQVTKAVGAAVAGVKCSRLRVVAHVGVNDAMSRGSEEILNSFRELNSEVKRVSAVEGVEMALTICSLVPRVDQGSYVWSRVEGINERLRGICKDIGANFVDLRPTLQSIRNPLNRSGIHYTAEASELVARRIHEHCQSF